MKILIACEFSGVVRRAFRDRGHEAYSCDLEESDDASPDHFVGDVLPFLADGWDMILAFPPCTHLAASGARWFPKKRADGSQQARDNARQRQRQRWDVECPLYSIASAPTERTKVEHGVT